MEKNTQTFFSVGSLAILFVVFVVLTILSSVLLRGARLDLTENRLYTLSEGTKNILRELPEPVTLHYFFSQDVSQDLPQIRSYASRVGELLDEFAQRSGGKLNIRTIDPKPFSEEEDQAAAFGLQAVPISTAGDSLYFGIAGTNSVDDLQIMPFLDPRKEEFLEYDLAKMVQGLGRTSKPVVGLLSSLPVTAEFDPATQRMREAWVIHDQMNQLFDLQTVDPATDGLPEGLDVLVLIHPKNLSQAKRYAIDQFVLKGGRLLAFLDPLAEAEAPANPADPLAAATAGSASDLPDLLAAWGVEYNSAEVVGDLRFALQVGVAPNQPPVRHLAVMGLPGEAMEQADVVSADLESVNLSSAGYFQAAEDAALTLQPLLWTSQNANTLASSRLRFLPNPAELLNGFNPTGERYSIAVRLTGRPASAFPDQLPEGIDPEQHVSSAEQDANILLFADTDLLSDRLWVQKQPFFGQSIVNAFADNGTLVINAIDNLLGNADLISIRARASSDRPFTRVESLRLDAEQRLRATEQRLQQELEDTERKLGELQSGRSDDNLAVLTAEQQTELQRFVDQRLQIRRDLRQVRRDLDREIEALGSRLKFVNIIVVPIAVALLALGFVRWRRRQRQGESS